jgi:hypothetical protein
MLVQYHDIIQFQRRCIEVCRKCNPDVCFSQSLLLAVCLTIRNMTSVRVVSIRS